MVAQPDAGRPSPAEIWRGEWLASSTASVWCWCAWKKGREVERRGGVHGAELSGEEELTPVSDSRPVKAYQGEPRRAQGARGGGGAQGETERSTASWGGRASQLRRGSAVAERAARAGATAAVWAMEKRREGGNGGVRERGCSSRARSELRHRASRLAGVSSPGHHSSWPAATSCPEHRLHLTYPVLASVHLGKLSPAVNRSPE